MLDCSLFRYSIDRGKYLVGNKGRVIPESVYLRDVPFQEYLQQMHVQELSVV